MTEIMPVPRNLILLSYQQSPSAIPFFAPEDVNRAIYL